MPSRSPKPKLRRKYYFVPLDLAKRFEALAAQRGVSRVARGEQRSRQTEGGFFQAAKRARGSRAQLAKTPIFSGAKQTWWQRRNNFCARHRAQQVDFHEALLEQRGKYKGTPTRRELGLIMWMCSAMPPSRLWKLLPRVDQVLQ